MWCAYSKTRAERDVAGHAGWLKRSLASENPRLVDDMDIEYSSGTVWTGEHMVASASRPVPPGVGEQDLLWEERLLSRPWVHIAAISGHTGLDATRVRALLEANRR